MRMRTAYVNIAAYINIVAHINIAAYVNIAACAIMRWNLPFSSAALTMYRVINREVCFFVFISLKPLH